MNEEDSITATDQVNEDGFTKANENKDNAASAKSDEGAVPATKPTPKKRTPKAKAPATTEGEESELEPRPKKKRARKTAVNGDDVKTPRKRVKKATSPINDQAANKATSAKDEAANKFAAINDEAAGKDTSFVKTEDETTHDNMFGGDEATAALRAQQEAGEEAYWLGLSKDVAPEDQDAEYDLFDRFDQPAVDQPADAI